MLPLAASHVAILAVSDLARSPYLTFPALAFALASWLWAAHRLELRISAGGVLLVAAGLRLALVPPPPTLSDDTLRYAWDGKVVLADCPRSRGVAASTAVARPRAATVVTGPPFSIRTERRYQPTPDADAPTRRSSPPPPARARPA